MKAYTTRCKQCGEPLEQDAKFCQACGSAVIDHSVEKPRIESNAKDIPEFGKNPIIWNAELKLLSHSVVTRQLFMVLAVSTLFLLSFILILEAIEGNLTFNSALRYFLISLGIMCVLSLLSVFVMLVVYGNRYEYQYVMDDKGVKSETVGGTRKKNNIINFLSLFTGKPTAAGAGLISASRQSELVKWEKVDSFTSNAKNLEILLRRKRRTIMLMRCTSDNYQSVLHLIEERIKPNNG